MFKSAKIKLTAWYLGILTVITVSFSIFLYGSVVRVTNRALESQRIRIERRLSGSMVFINPAAPPMIDPETSAEIKERTLFLIIIVNAVILGISGLLSYFLAGLTLKPIEEMLYRQKRFVSDAAHDLKTPLTALKTDFEVTLRDPNLEINSAKETIKSAVGEVDRLTTLVNKLLKQSKYENGVDSMKKETLDTEELIKESVKIVKPLAEEKNIKIETSYEGDKKQIIGDKDSLIEVFINLLENAVKFSPNEKTISVITKYRNNDVIFIFKDQGTGIKENEINQIFNPFFKSEFSRNIKENKGYGLGLSISRNIIEKHSGCITVKSELEKGSTFKVVLPVKKDGSQLSLSKGN